MKPKITPCLWFDFNAEEAVDFYLRTFGDGRILRTSRYGEAMPQHRGKVMLIEFELFGQPLPRGMIEMHTDADPVKARRAAEAMFTMKKIDIAAVRRAFDGEA